MEKTPVEWLVEQLTENGKYPFILAEDVVAIEQAKAMEKEQIIDAYKADLYPCSDEDAEQYYNETFKSE